MNGNILVGTLILIALAAVVIQVVQAAEGPAELKNETVKIQDIVKNEPAFDGKYVVIVGKIDSECGSGCWFIVDDGTAQLYVDILPSNFVIPQKRGSNVKVYGEVTTRDNDPLLIGKIAEIGERFIDELPHFSSKKPAAEAGKNASNSNWCGHSPYCSCSVFLL